MENLKTFWISWTHHRGMGRRKKLAGPCYLTAQGLEGERMFCTVLQAPSEEEAWALIRNSYRKKPENLDKRFCIEKPTGWSPNSDRFGN